MIEMHRLPLNVICHGQVQECSSPCVQGRTMISLRMGKLKSDHAYSFRYLCKLEIGQGIVNKSLRMDVASGSWVTVMKTGAMLRCCEWDTHITSDLINALLKLQLHYNQIKCTTMLGQVVWALDTIWANQYMK